MKKASTYSILILIIGFSVILHSCKKPEPEPKDPLTNEQLLTGEWQLITFTKNGVSMIEPCSADDIFEFNVSKRYYGNEGTLKCNENDPTVFAEGSWEFKDDNRILRFPFYGDINDFKVNKLTETEMELSLTVSDNQYLLVFKSL